MSDGTEMYKYIPENPKTKYRYHKISSSLLLLILVSSTTQLLLTVVILYRMGPPSEAIDNAGTAIVKIADIIDNVLCNIGFLDRAIMHCSQPISLDRIKSLLST
jgi:hypothetical protein